MKKPSSVICFDFDDVITDGNLIRNLVLSSRISLSDIRTGLELLEDNRDPKKFFKMIKTLVMLGKGMRFDAIEKAVLKTKLMKNTKDTFKQLRKSSVIVIVSMNDERIIRKFLEKHGLGKYVSHIYASCLDVENNRLTGIISGDVIRTEKLGIVKALRKSHKGSEIIYIGDGLTDLPLIKKVDKGILFCPNELTKAEVFSDKALMKKENNGNLFLVEKKDLKEIIKFIQPT